MAHQSESVQLDLATPRPWRRFIPSWLRSLIWIDSAKNYDAFLSYSWKSDSEVAPVIQSVIQRFLCPWYRLRAKTIFRDLSCLPAGSSLESELLDRLDRSMHLIVLASPESAHSQGMEMEARHWFSRQRDGQVLVLVTAGECNSWHEIQAHLLPPAVRNGLVTEPLWVPLRRRDEILANPKSHDLRGALAEDLKQILLRFYPGRDWGQLRGEERSQRRRAIGLVSGVAVALLILAVAAVGFGLYAQAQRTTAVARELTAYSVSNLVQDPNLGLLLAMHAVSLSTSMRNGVIPEAEDALHRAMQTPYVRFVLRGHKDDLTGAVWSPDGDRLATASRDGTSKVWDAATGRERFTLTGHSGAVLGIAWRPDGKQLATASFDGTIKVWDGTAGSCLRTLATDEGVAITSVSWSSDGMKLATAGSIRSMILEGRDRVPPSSGKVQVWDADTGNELQTLPASEAVIDTVAWSPTDANRLATASQDATAITIWDLTKRRKLTWTAHSSGVLGVAWSPDGTHLVTASKDRTAKVWMASGTEETTFMGHNGEVEGVAWSADGKRVATVSNPLTDARDNSAKIWATPSYGPVGHLELLTLPNLVATVPGPRRSRFGGRRLSLIGPQGRSSFVAWSPDGKRLVTRGDIGTAKIWDVAPAELPTLVGSAARIESIAWSPDGRRLASAGWDGMVRVWETASGQELFAIKGSIRRRPLSVAWSPDGRQLATAGLDLRAKVWDVVTKKDEPLLLSGHKKDATYITWSSDGKKLATASLDGTAKVWDAVTGKELVTLSGHTGRVRRTAWRADGRLLATAGDDDSIKVWDAGSGSQVKSWIGHMAEVYDVGWSPDGKRLATASADQTAKVWDAATGRLLLTLSGHEETVNRIAWSPDGKRLVTASADQTARVWDAATGRLLLTFFSHGGAVLHAAWSPDGKRLATASASGEVGQYAMDADLLLALARSRAQQFTTEECEKFLHVEACPPIP